MATKAEKALLTRKAWVLQEIGWEYDDSYYYRGDTRGGIAKRVYFQQDKAIRDCAKLNAQKRQEEIDTDSRRETYQHTYITEFYEIIEVEVV